MSRTIVFLSAAGLFLCALVGASAGRAADCNRNGKDDLQDISSGASRDCNANAVPDECEQGTGDITFEVVRQMSIGFVGAVVAEDLDLDGDVDFATAGSDIMVFLNRGNGEFEEAGRYPVGELPWNMVGADLNADGYLDLVATSYATNEVPVLLNRGDGSFTLDVRSLIRDERLYSTTRPAVALDLDADGDVDVAIWTPGGISILRNDGNGSLALAEVFLPGNWRPGLTTADLDSDGDADFALSEGNTDSSSGQTVAVFRYKGGGAFAEPAIYPVGERPGRILAADLDGDTALDLVATKKAADAVSVLRNRGDGTFDDVRPVAVGHTAEHIASGDFNADGKEDLLVAGTRDGEYRAGKLSILWNVGDGSFGPPVKYEFTDEVQCIATPDLNGDGLSEIAVLLYLEGKVGVLENKGAGAFGQPQIFRLNFGGAYSIEARDLDGDADLDLITGHLGAGLQILVNATGQALTTGCDLFLRGDVNQDGAVSVSDTLMLRRFFFEESGLVLPCLDAADVSDDETLDITDAVTILNLLFATPDWGGAMPAPFPEPGLDPTVLPVPPPSPGQPDSILGCGRYSPEPAERTGDLIRIGDIEASPGAEVLIPVYMSSSVRVAAIQLVLEYDPETFEIAGEDLDYGGTFCERFGWVPAVSSLMRHPDAGAVTAAIAGSLHRQDRDIPPGTNILVAWIRVKISEEVAPGTMLSLMPTNGPDGLGVGPFRLRNEITFQGGARLVSTLPGLEGGYMAIVGDQAFFRGDSNGDEKLDMSDAIHTLGALFFQARPISCQDAADTNDDGEVNISDPIFTLNFLFTGGPWPPAPYPERGTDPTADELSCYIVKRP